MAKSLAATDDVTICRVDNPYVTVIVKKCLRGYD